MSKLPINSNMIIITKKSTTVEYIFHAAKSYDLYGSCGFTYFSFLGRAQVTVVLL